MKSIYTVTYSCYNYESLDYDTRTIDFASENNARIIAQKLSTCADIQYNNPVDVLDSTTGEVRASFKKGKCQFSVV